MAFVLTGDREVAADLVQEAFVGLASRFAHLRDMGRFERYLHRAVVNRARSYFRRRGTEKRFLTASSPLAERVEGLPDIETRHELWQSLQELPPRQRVALILRYYEDLPEVEVAEILGTSQRAVNSLVARGLEHLRRRGRNQRWTE